MDKSLMRLLECVLADAGTWCSTSTTRDFNTIARRVEHEGVSFVTITLPTFCQDFERGLEEGRIDSSHFLGFKKRGALPVFLQGLLNRVFDASDGTLLKEVDPLAIHAVRQICLMYKKLLLSCSKERERKSYANFIETDRSVAEFESRLEAYWSSTPVDPRDTSDSRVPESGSSSDEPAGRSCHPMAKTLIGRQRGGSRHSPMELHHFTSVARILWGELFHSDSFRVDDRRVLPRHGPGATAERISGNRKFDIRRWHQRLDHWFPVSDFAIPNLGFAEELTGIQFVPPEQEQPVRVISVPKTLKSPRIIAIEPVCMQYTQQAVMEILVERLESYGFTKGHMNFTDQTVNQDLARKSSIDQSLATLDLKDASDRVSARLVWEMLESQPVFRELVFATRSLTANVPGHGVIPLHRFASMGSALCFPIEAMVFYTIIVSAIHRAERYPLTRNGLMKARSGVRVYGDDIIVPVRYVQTVVNELEWFNLRVNTNKSFWTGKFRESCGLDAYDGIPVTPVYCRRTLPTSRRNADELISGISLANQLYKAGYWQSAAYLRSLIGRIATVPHVAENSSILGWHSVANSYEVQSWDKHRHCWTVKGLTVDAKSRKDPLDGFPALMKFFLKRGKEPYHDEEHLERYGRPLAVYTKLRWAQPY